VRQIRGKTLSGLIVGSELDEGDAEIIVTEICGLTSTGYGRAAGSLAVRGYLTLAGSDFSAEAGCAGRPCATRPAPSDRWIARRASDGRHVGTPRLAPREEGTPRAYAGSHVAYGPNHPPYGEEEVFSGPVSQ
jgi:hypothetical protein